MERPLIWTTKGNLPMNELHYEAKWEDAEGFIKLVETYKLGDEVVRESAHVFIKKALTVMGEQGGF